MTIIYSQSTSIIMRLGDISSINIYLRQTQFPYSEICELRKRLILNIHVSGHLNKIELKISCIAVVYY